MSERVAAVYRWATMGGVERVLLNRAEAFRAEGVDVRIDAHFLHDSGGLAPFADYITERGLGDHLRIRSQLDVSEYDRVLVIDTPEFLEQAPSCRARTVVECHTSYADNRRYLRRLPADLAGIVAPSEHFAGELAAELPAFADRVFVLRNTSHAPEPPAADRIPLPWHDGFLIYLGRIDGLKNVTALLDGHAALLRRGDTTVLAVVGPEPEPGGLRKQIDARGTSARVVALPAVGFAAVRGLLQSTVLAGGIMVSASTGESFGLSVAEAIGAGLRLVLSDIAAHRWFEPAGAVQLFDSASPDAFCAAVDAARADAVDAARREAFWREHLSPAAFVADWERLAARLVTA